MSRGSAALLRQLDETLAAHGLTTRGATVEHAWTPDHAISGTGPRASELVGHEGSRTIVLVGHAGSSIWPHFSAWRREAPDGDGPDPLDRWSRHMLETVAKRFGARAVFPSDRPYLPFQQWAQAAEGLRPSPLGILMHPVYGLWHAYRGALIFKGLESLPPPVPKPHPCDSCMAKPCLTLCPVSAFSAEGYDVAGCRSFLRSDEGPACLTSGCQARRACPVGRDYTYVEAQQRFHMAAFSAAG